MVLAPKGRSNKAAATTVEGSGTALRPMGVRRKAFKLPPEDIP